MILVNVLMKARGTVARNATFFTFTVVLFFMKALYQIQKQFLTRQ